MLKLRTEDLTWQIVDDELVCLDLSTSRYLLVNASGAVLWPQLVAGTDLPQMALTLSQTFALDGDAALRDAAGFVEVLEGRGLLLPR